MALAVTNKASNGDTSNITGPFTSASFTPAANSLIIAVFQASRGSSANPDIPTVSDTAGLTWTQITGGDFTWLGTGTGRNRVTIFAAQAGSSPAAMTVSANYANALIGCAWNIFEVTGSAVAGGVAGCFVQLVQSTANATGATAAVTLAAAGDANNRAFLLLAHAANEALTVSAWTNIGNGSYASPNTAVSSQWKSAAFDTAPTAAWATSTNYGMIGYEIKAASTATYSVSVTTATIAYAANDVTFRDTLPQATASYAFGVGAVNFAVTLPAASASYPLAASDVTLKLTLPVASASFGGVTASAVNFKVTLPVATASYAFTGNAATFRGTLSQATASYAFGVGAVNFKITIPVTSASYAYALKPWTPYYRVNCLKGSTYLPSGGSLSTTVMGSPNTDCLVIGCRWYDLEPTEGNYNFTTAAIGESLAAQLVKLVATNKPCRLTIATAGPGFSAGGQKPDWLITYLQGKGTQFFTYRASGVPTTIPVFWDSWLIAKRILLVQQIAAYLASVTQLKMVYCDWVNAATNDWNMGSISSASDGLGGSPKSRWQTAISFYPAYADVGAALIDAGNQLYAAYAAAFPGKILTTSIGRVDDVDLNFGGAANNGRNIIEAVLSSAETAHPGTIAAQKNNMNANGVWYPVPTPPPTSNDWYDLWYMRVTYGIHIGVQMVWAAIGDNACSPDTYGAQRMNYNGGPCIDSTLALRLAVEKSKAYKAKWAEIYESDLANLGVNNADPVITDLYDIGKHAHRTLLSGYYINFGSNESNNGGAGPITLQPTGNFAFNASAVTFALSQAVVHPDTAVYAFNAGAVNFKVTLPQTVVNYPLTVRPVGVYFGRRVSVTTASFAYNASAVTLLMQRKLSVTKANYQYMLFVSPPILFRVTLPVETASFATDAGVVHFPRGQAIESLNYAFNVSTVSLRANRTVFVDSASYAFTAADIALQKAQTKLVVESANFAVTFYSIGLPGSIFWETGNFAYAFNVIGIDYTPTPPEPVPVQTPVVVPPGMRSYNTLQGDTWDMISLRSYGMKRGSDHHIDTLIAANPALREIREFPGGFVILIPELPVQAEIELVPWKKATVTA